MTIISKLNRASLLIAAVSLSSLMFVGAASAAAAAGAGTTNSSTASSSSTTSEQHLQNIITKGNAEITRRLTSLDGLSSKISSSTKLTASDKTSLTAEVSSEISGLTTLKTQLDGETTLSAASTDAQFIYNEYRVYALIVPKVELIQLADREQQTDTSLSTLAQKLQSRITADQNAGKDVATLQSELNDLSAKTTAAAGIASSIESAVVNLQPSDYNANHTVLSGDNTQLKAAHSDNEAAAADAKNIVAALKTL